VRGVHATTGPVAGYLALLLNDRLLPGGLLHVVAAAAAGLALSTAGLLLDRAPFIARTLCIAAIAAPVALSPVAMLANPTLAFLILMGGGTIIAAAFLSPLSEASPLCGASEGRAIALRWSAYVSVSVWVVLLIAGRLDSAPGQAAAIACFGITLLHALRWVLVASDDQRQRRHLLAIALALAVVATTLILPDTSAITHVLAASSLLAVWLAPGASAIWAGVIGDPARLLIVTFAALCFGGSALLALPVASAIGSSVGVLDAAFTAVSAVCVTGLAVLDTPRAFSFVGQAFILLLIQLGGLGIMTFYSAAFSLLGKRLSLRHERAIAGALSIEDRGHLFGALGRVLRVTVIAESLGAAVLFARFLREDASAADALWRAVFTSISAFCNAGFALQSNSLIGYNQDPLILHAIALLVIAGGLSPIAITSLPKALSGRRTTLQVRLVLTTTAILLVAGFLGFATFEWTNPKTLGELSYPDRLHNAWFQSVTTRTAGFNAIDIAAMRPATQTLTIGLMFIGGSPGSTAGGAKTTTIAVLLLAVGAALRRRTEVTVFGRRLGHATVYRAAAVFMVGVSGALAALVAVQLTQPIELGPAVFEVVSAIATVGLSVGATGTLDSVGKVIIIGCMFAGRVGPLTLFLFLTEPRDQPSWERPEEEVDVG
jgi:trk system potassium uptake protein TrkH